MSEGMNKVYLLGNLGADPELKHATNGTAYLRFRLATTERWKDKQGELQERTDWHTVQLWGKRAEALANYLSKGSRVMVEGKVETNSYEKDGQPKYFTYVKARDIFLTDRARPASRPAVLDEAGRYDAARDAASAQA